MYWTLGATTIPILLVILKFSYASLQCSVKNELIQIARPVGHGETTLGSV